MVRAIPLVRPCHPTRILTDYRIDVFAILCPKPTALPSYDCGGVVIGSRNRVCHADWWLPDGKAVGLGLTLD